MLANLGHDAVVNAATVSWMQRHRVFSIGHDGVVYHGECEGVGAHACGTATICFYLKTTWAAAASFSAQLT
jgi:hypothetical protein